MIADPCNSVLAPGIYGDQEGLLARVKQTFTNPGNSQQTCGYILWTPDYHAAPTNAGSYNRGSCNIFAFSNADPAYQPLNTPAVPYGSDQEHTVWGGAATAASLPDPASDLLYSDLVSDARSISSCLKMTYTGAMQSAAGQYCMIEALPLNSIIKTSQSGGPVGYSASVDDLFRLATRSGRLGTDTREAISRPDDSSHVFRSGATAPIEVGDSGAQASDITELGRNQQPIFYGFAWRGVPPGADHPLVFELVKTLEWRPAPISGLTHAPPRAINSKSMVHSAVQHLDKHAPGWSDRLASSAIGLASSLAKSAFTGVASAAANEMIGFAEAAPFAALTLL